MSSKIGYFVVGIVLGAILTVLFYTYGIPIMQENMQTEELNFNLQQEVSNLHDEYGDPYSVREYDWKVWSQTWKASGGKLSQMRSWQDFIESLRQNPFTFLLMLDKENEIVWYKTSSSNLVIYYNK